MAAYPHFVARAGMKGTVVETENDLFCVRLDEPLDGAEEWDNEVAWYENAFGPPEEDLAHDPR